MRQVWLLLLSALVLTAGALMWFSRQASPPVESVVASSLESLHEQNRLSAFAARFVTVVTSRKGMLGFNAQKTLIVPAMVRYEVDLSQLKASDLSWNAAAKTLSVRLPPVQIGGIEFDLSQVQEYESGAVLLALTDVEKLLDDANRAKARADVQKQAQAPTVIKLARDATAQAVARGFAMPLKAAGVDAAVKVEFR